MKTITTLPRIIILPLCSLALVGLLASCHEDEHHRPTTAVYSIPGVYASLPDDYHGSYYRHDGRYYYGGTREEGRYLDNGRYYNDRYSHNGRYYYGGQYYPGQH